MAPEYTRAAKQWLEDNGYWGPAAGSAESTHTNSMDAIALTVARMLPSIKSSSGLPLRVRAGFFRRVMQAVHEELYPIAQAYAAEDRTKYPATPHSDRPD